MVCRNVFYLNKNNISLDYKLRKVESLVKSKRNDYVIIEFNPWYSNQQARASLGIRHNLHREKRKALLFKPGYRCLFQEDYGLLRCRQSEYRKQFNCFANSCKNQEGQGFITNTSF